jgi:hypothetical protein
MDPGLGVDGECRFVTKACPTRINRYQGTGRAGGGYGSGRGQLGSTFLEESGTQDALDGSVWMMIPPYRL